MIAFLKKNPSCKHLLVEKTDQLYRNIKDWVTVDELPQVIHMVKEGVVLSPESRSSEKFMHGIKVLMAKNFIDNLSEEASKGMLEKARQAYTPAMPHWATSSVPRVSQSNWIPHVLIWSGYYSKLTQSLATQSPEPCTESTAEA